MSGVARPAQRGRVLTHFTDGATRSVTQLPGHTGSRFRGFQPACPWCPQPRLAADGLCVLGDSSRQGPWPLSTSLDGAALPLVHTVVDPNTGRERALGRAWAAARGGGEAVEAAPTARVALEETESWFKQLSHRHVARKPQHRIPQTPCGPVGNCPPPPAQPSVYRNKH